ADVTCAKKLWRRRGGCVGLCKWVSYMMFYLLATVFCAVLTYCMYVHHVHQKYDHIPGPPRDSFLLGHIPTFSRGAKSDNLTILMSPKYTKDPFVYKRLFNLFGKRFLGNGLVTAMDHDDWYRQRRIMDPAFSTDAVLSTRYLRSLMGTFNEMSERLMDHLEEIADTKTPVIMHDLVNCVTLDVICKAAFGVDLNLFKQTDSPFQKAVEQCLKGMVFYLRDPFFRLFPKNWKTVQQTKDATELLRKTGNKWIQKRKTAIENGEDVPKDILTQILKTENVNNTKDHELMLDNFVTFFIAGQETTANQLSFAIMELGRHPEIYKRAKAEVDEILGTKINIPYEDLGKFTYLSQVLKETLRLYPTAPGTSRWLHEDMVINGLKIPGSCAVIFSSYVSQRLGKFFKDPLKFDPERFDVNAPKPYYCYYPFALGPRTCLGQVFSQMEAKVVLAKLLQRFEFSLVPGQSFDIKDTGTLRPKSGVICNIKHCS
uniref:Cholesterol 24-hydroxylase n=1 Tax=Sinocyclocheilus grahami TaxID=75366 RepID=A0A672T4Z9_SINGR